MRSLPLLVLAPLLLSCASARDRAVERALAAREAGDLAAAARAWEEACGIDPEACPRAAAARDEAVAEVALQAAPACRSGEPGPCVAALRPGRALAPDAPALVALAEEAARLTRARCGEEASLEALACAEAWRDRLAAPENDRILAGWRERLAAELRREAAATADPGAIALLRGGAACLSGRGEDAAAASEAATGLDAAIALPVALTWRVEGLAPRIRCDELVEGIGLPLRCGVGGLVLAVDGALAEAAHQRRSEAIPVEWVAGTTRSANPAWESASARVLFLEDSVRQLELQRTLADRHCEAAESIWRQADLCLSCSERTFRDAACDAAHDLEGLERDRGFELLRARSDLDATPALLEEEVRARATVERLHHRWTAPWEATLLLGEARRRISGVAVHEDAEHAALPAASLPADPIALPPVALGADELAAAARDAAAQLLRGALAARAAERARACPLPWQWDEAWLRCRAEVQRLEGRRADDGSWLSQVAGGGLRCR